MAASTPPTQGTAIARRSADAVDPYVQDQPVPAPSGGTPYALTTPIAKILQSDAARAVIQPLVPHGVSWERVIMEVHRAAVDNPQILKCTEQSIIKAVGQAVETGLVIGKTIHLVPLKNTKANVLELNAWTDYKGDIELVLWSGAARHVDAHAVYAGDQFTFELGSNPFVRHIPELNPAKRGKLVAGYSVALLNGSGTIKKIVVMPIDEIERIRKGSRQWSPDRVAVCPDWYVEKTCIHRNTKTLPRNRRLATVMAIMDSREAADRVDSELDGLNQIEAPEPHQLRAPLSDAPSVRGAGEEDDRGARREASAEVSDAAQTAAVPTANDVDAMCPKCGGMMWDNRTSKTNPKAPDFKCRDRSCDGVYWPGQWPPASPASDEQRTRILVLLGEADLDNKRKEKIERMLAKTDKPLTATRADEIIAGLVALMPAKAAADVGATNDPLAGTADDELPF